jgi:hypothetical protein
MQSGPKKQCKNVSRKDVWDKDVWQGGRSGTPEYSIPNRSMMKRQVADERSQMRTFQQRGSAAFRLSADAALCASGARMVAIPHRMTLTRRVTGHAASVRAVAKGAETKPASSHHVADCARRAALKAMLWCGVDSAE